jgi:hypothetical protein
MAEPILCRDCRHWRWSNRFNLDEYPRDRPIEEGWADGVCAKLLQTLVIECSGGWDGCTIDSVETDANFWCALAEPRD